MLVVILKLLKCLTLTDFKDNVHRIKALPTKRKNKRQQTTNDTNVKRMKTGGDNQKRTGRILTTFPNELIQTARMGHQNTATKSKSHCNIIQLINSAAECNITMQKK